MRYIHFVFNSFQSAINSISTRWIDWAVELNESLIRYINSEQLQQVKRNEVSEGVWMKRSEVKLTECNESNELTEWNEGPTEPSETARCKSIECSECNERNESDWMKASER